MSAPREDMLCSNCYFHEPPKKGAGFVGECRRYPPQMLAREVYAARLSEGEWQRNVEAADANWPLVGADDWCGEWRPK